MRVQQPGVAIRAGAGAAVLTAPFVAVGRVSTPEMASPRASVASRRAGDVLIVAADPRVVESSSAGLVGAGDMVHVATDADAGLAGLLQTRYRLLLVDLEEDSSEGMRLLRALRAQPALRPGAVLVISALGRRSPVLAAMEAGADDYISKPVDPNDLALRAALWLRRVGLAVPVARPGLRIHSLGRF